MASIPTAIEVSAVRRNAGDLIPPYKVSDPVLKQIWLDADNADSKTLETTIVQVLYALRAQYINDCGDITDAVEKKIRIMDSQISKWEDLAGMGNAVLQLGYLDLNLDTEDTSS